MMEMLIPAPRTMQLLRYCFELISLFYTLYLQGCHGSREFYFQSGKIDILKKG